MKPAVCETAEKNLEEYPPPAGGGLIEAYSTLYISNSSQLVSPARGRGPH